MFFATVETNLALDGNPLQRYGFPAVDAVKVIRVWLVGNAVVHDYTS
jgi:hypothetical protein